MVGRIGCGPIERTNVVIARTGKGGNDKNLFGMDLLNESKLHFLPGQKEVEILSAVPPGIRVEALHLDSGSIPFIELECRGQKAMAVWDTGAGITIVDKKFFNDNRDLFSWGEKTAGTDSAGNTFEAEIYLMQSVSIGGYRFPPHRVVPLDINHLGSRTGRGMDFILGYSTLRHANWLMDFPGRAWAITKVLF